MGFDASLVVSEERYHGAFLCAICQNLVDHDCLVTTSCSHCFCKSCLPVWLERSSKCPTCNQDLLYAHNSVAYNKTTMMIGDHATLVQPLATAQPLAHRLLQSILVKCPLHTSVHCDWQGDYGDLESHLLSSTAHCTTTPPSSTSTSTCTAGSDSHPSLSTASPTTSSRDQGECIDVNGTMKRQQIALASSLKVEANGKFESKHYKEAQSLYSKAIQVLQPFLSDPSVPALLATLYSNRAAAYLQLQSFTSCLDDCRLIIQQGWDPSNLKVYVRACRACIQLGDLIQAQHFLQFGFQEHPGNSTLNKEKQTVQYLVELEVKAQQELQSRQYGSAKSRFGNLLMEAPSAVPFLLGAAQADLGLGLTDSCLRMTKRVLLQHAQNPMGCWIRGQAVFLMGDAKVGIQLLQEALRLDPDSTTFKQSYKQAKQVQEWLTLAQQALFSRKFQTAIDHLTQCLEAYQPTITTSTNTSTSGRSALPSKCALYATLYTQRAEAYLRLKQYANALKDCALVTYAQEDHVPAWLIRFQAHHGLGEHAIVLEQVGDLLQKWPQDHRLRQAYERADFLHRKEKRLDYYQLLGIPSIASEIEIKKAYKRKALELHPDKVPPGSSSEIQQQAQKRFQQLGEALEILTDDFQRRLYDEGYDPEAIRERVEAAKQAAHNHRSSSYHHGHSPHGHASHYQ